jgi:hypothetical protein
MGHEYLQPVSRWGGGGDLMVFLLKLPDRCGIRALPTARRQLLETVERRGPEWWAVQGLNL